MKKIIFSLLILFSINVAQSQKVGIGTTAPAAKLDVTGTASNPDIPGPTSTAILRIGVGVLEGIDIGKSPITPYSGWMQAGYGNDFADPMSFQPLGGNVGIGTLTPVSKLTLFGAGAAPTIPGNASSGIFRIGVSAIEGIDFGKMGTTPFTGWIQSGINGSTTHPLSLQPSGGNVGIGTTGPAAKLSIQGPGLAPAIPGTSSNGSFRISASTTDGMDMGKMNAVPFAGWIQSGFGGSFPDPMSLQPLGGNVAIGLTTPAAKLDVQGAGSSPIIPGTTSNGILRLRVSATSAVDIGKMTSFPYSGWLQTGTNGVVEALSIQPLGGNVGIGTVAPAISAALEIKSTNQGFLPPRMTYSERNAIASPVAGLVVWCTDCDELQVYNGTVWKDMTGHLASPPSQPYLTMCAQKWTIKNLDVSHYRNGDPIPKVTDPVVWNSLTTGAYCYYNNDSVTYAAVYGKMYNGYAVMDPRGLAPAGWHIPTRVEWQTLVDCMSGSDIAGGRMKEVGYAHWFYPNAGAIDIKGFNALPAGQRHYPSGAFGFVGERTYWWSSTEYMTNSLYAQNLVSDYPYCNESVPEKKWGMSVRCIRD